MRPLALDLLRDCLEGVVPGVLATCDETGKPNVMFISQVHYVDPQRVALSYQFFNKTRRNLLAMGRASVAIFDPVSFGEYRLELDYEETQTEGPLFETMKAKLAGIASHSGLEGVFRLLGSDICRIRSIETIFEPTAAAAVPDPKPAGGGGCATREPPPDHPLWRPIMQIETLRAALRGTLIARDEASYDHARKALLFNASKPDRYPALIVRAADVTDVQAAVRFAAAEGLVISVRGSGHNWSGIALQDGIVLDVSALDAVSIDPTARIARWDPACGTGRLRAS